MADTLSNVQLGPCQIYINGTDVGHSIGGVEYTYAAEFHEVKLDKYGNTIAEKFLLGEKLTAKLPLAEFTLNNIKRAIPFGTLSGGKVTIGKIAGAKATDQAMLIVCHPRERAAGDRSFDLVIYKAIQTGEVTIKHDPDAEKVLECTFEGLIDETRSDGNMLGLIGDSTA
jgi:hypothetical protein